MKTGFIASTIAALLLAGLVVWGMGRISDLEAKVTALEEAKVKAETKPTATTARASMSSATEAPSKTGRIMKPRPPEVAEAEPEDVEEAAPNRPEEALGELIRAFAKSEAGQALEQWGNKSRAGGLYGNLIEEFDFTEEEKDYFLEVAGSGVGANDALWRDLMTASDEIERLEIVEEFEAAAAKRESDMREFLNDEEDYQRYADYEERIPEYQQIGGLRNAMQNAGVPLSTEQETQLVEAMYSGRVESGIDDRWEGRGALNQVGQPGLADRLTADWEGMQDSMGPGVDQVLEPAQQEIFDQQQNQALQGITMGLRFAESTFSGGGE